MDMDKIKQDKVLLEKILLAYWYSIPFDNDTTPDKIIITKDNKDYFATNLMKGSLHYGCCSIKKSEVDKYLEKLKNLKEHEIDIIDKIEREVDK